ncbi:TPA: hypothetical protein SML50_005253 [Serratia fonticola]|nr:hypothetical protein [Serratia fonticola]HEJ9060888.1 hypothetical protein [Serratia fonticola]
MSKKTPIYFIMLIVIIIVIVILSFLLGEKVFYQEKQNNLSCDAILKLYSLKSKENEFIDGVYHYEMADGNGLITINVEVLTAKGELSEHHVSFTFNYTQKNNNYTLNNIKYSSKIHDSGDYKLSDPILMEILDQYIINVKDNLTFRVVKMKDSGYLFYTNKIPLMMCMEELR